MDYNKASKYRYGSAAPLNILKLGLSGVAINLIGAWFVSSFNLPLYLDTTGTVFVAVLGGYLPGITAGLLTNLLKDFSDTSAIYYGALNVLIALASGFFSNRKYLNKLSGIISLILILSTIGGGIGFLISWLLYGQAYQLSAAHFLVRSGVPYIQASFAADFIFDLCDKTITVLLVIALIRLLPPKLKERMHIFGWHQNPLTEDIMLKVKSIKCRISSLRTRILTLLILASLLITMAITGVCAILYRNATIRELAQLGEGVASVAAGAINPEEVGYYLEQGADRQGYDDTKDMLFRIMDSTEDIIYISICKYLPDGSHVIYDLEDQEGEGLSAGMVKPYDESFMSYVPDLLAGKPIEPVIKKDKNGLMMCIYQPVYDSLGRCVCYATVYMSMNSQKNDQRQFLAKLTALCFGFLVLIFAAGAWLAEFDIIYPVNSMAYVADAFAYNTEEARLENVENIRQLDVRTGDEIENLYRAFCRTIEDSVATMKELEGKTRLITHMQDGLTMVLADMVESRDLNTGQHVRKTAAYVRIIMDQMQEEGIYTEALTDRFISDVIRSAPLHDIGKINIPDAILNKPGRLTSDEFEIMKTHTTAGRDILLSAIENVPDADYLWEAKDLAAHHHERWDGGGYPDGLSGEEIPLSARIMAIADVFDALVSRRSYKAGFPFEKAMDIIKEGVGTQFDPNVAKAFIHAEDKVRMVSEKLGEDEVIRKGERDEAWRDF